MNYNLMHSITVVNPAKNCGFSLNFMHAVNHSKHILTP
jgi:hypothetical protein